MTNRTQSPQSQAIKQRRFRLSDKYSESESLTPYKQSDLVSELKLRASLTPQQIIVRDLGLEDNPLHFDMFELEQVRVAIWNDQFGKVERKVRVPFDQAITYEFVNLDCIPNLRFYTITISIELPIGKYNEWPRDRNGKPLLNCPVLGIDSDIPIPLPNYLILSRPDRQPPRADLIYILETPVWGTPNARIRPIKLYYNLQALMRRKLGGYWIGKDGFSYNPYWKEFREQSQAFRLSIMRQCRWEMRPMFSLFEKMPDCNKQGRDEARLEAIKSGEPYRQIAERFGEHPSTICRKAKKEGISKPTRSFTPQEINAVKCCRSRNLSLRETASETGFSIGKVQRIQKFINR